MGSCLSRGTVPENKVCPEFDDKKDYLGERGYSKEIKNKDGVSLFAYFWPALGSVPLKGIIQIAHGSETYTCFDYLKFKGPGQPNVYEGSWVAAFNQAGFAVCGIDHQGYGRSKGVRSQAGRFNIHVDNLLLLSEYVAENEATNFPKGLPYFLVGYSMGGLAATLACLQQPDRFAGLVLLSPMLALKEGASLRSKVTPKTEDGSNSSQRPVPWLFEAWAADPYVHDGGMRPVNLEEVQPATERLMGPGGVEALALPLLIFQSERDTYVEPDGARKLHERAASTDKKLRLLSQQWHVLTKEDGWEEVLAETSTWMSALATNSGALTRGLAEGAAEAAKEAGEDAAGSAAGGEAAAGEGGDGGKAEEAKAKEKERKEEEMSPPLRTRSMSTLERMPEHEPLMPRDLSGGGAGGLPLRRYSFSGGRTPASSGMSLLGPLPPIGQRRSLGTLPPELAAYGMRNRLPPLPPLLPLMDRKPIA